MLYMKKNVFEIFLLKIKYAKYLFINQLIF